MGQGTVRPFSERGFFLLFSTLFGLNPVPFRMLAFLTQFANMALLGSITRRLTGSRTAGLLAALLWVGNDALSVPLSWSSAYNQILCSFFVLLSFFFLLRYAEQGRTRDLAAQWVAFVLGFGALELNVVYPALATAYALCCARRVLKSTLLLWIPSVLFFLIHKLVAHWPVQEGLYALHFGAGLWSTMALYWNWAVGPSQLRLIYSIPNWPVTMLTSAMTVALLTFVVWRLRRRELFPLFCLGWFWLTLLPVIPLRDHTSNYYLTLPTVGLAMLLAWTLVRSWELGLTARAVGLAVTAAYLFCSLPLARATAFWHLDRGQRVKNVVFAVKQAHEQYPGKVILLAGVDEDLFRGAVYDDSFRRLFGIPEVFLMPNSNFAAEIAQQPGLSKFVYPPELVLRAAKQQRVRIYDVGREASNDITADYYELAQQRWKAGQPRRVDVGLPSFADQLGPTWYPPEKGFRWMPRRATVTLAGPRRPAERLYIRGYCPAVVVKDGPLEMRFRLGDHNLPPVQLMEPDASFEFQFSLPRELVGRNAIEVTVEVERTFRAPNDRRPLGVIFRTFEIR